MTNLKFIKTIILVILSTIIFSEQSFAVYETKDCSDAKGLMCWQCGTDCTATLYDGGKLIISGTGAMSYAGGYSQSTFIKSSNPGLPQDVTSVTIKEGITSIPQDAFYKVSNITKIELADSVRTIGGDGINPTRPYQLIISENSDITGLDTSHHSVDNISSVFCKGDISVCQSKLIAANSKFQNKTIVDELYDSEGNLLEKCKAGSCLTYEYNDKGNLNKKSEYDSAGNLKKSWNYLPDGSIFVYDSSEKLIGAKKTSPFTPVEAAGLVRKGNNNTVTLTFK